jgi:hypothetical protein
MKTKIDNTIENFNQYIENRSNYYSSKSNNTENIDTYIKDFVDDLYSDIVKERKERPKTFTINKDSDKLHDNFRERIIVLEYKRYGQFISLAYEHSPDVKYVIDLFELYDILKERAYLETTKNLSLSEKVKKSFSKIFKK